MTSEEEARERAHIECIKRGPYGISCGPDCAVSPKLEEALNEFRRTCFVLVERKGE